MTERYKWWLQQRKKMRELGLFPIPYCVICQLEIYMPWYVVFGEHEFTICEPCEEWLEGLTREDETS